MTDKNNFYDRGVDTGTAYQQGQDAITERSRAGIKFNDEHSLSAQRSRALTDANDNTEYATGRARMADADRDAMYPRAPAAPGAPGAPGSPAALADGSTPGSGLPVPADDSGAPPVVAGANPAGTGLPAPGAPVPSASPSKYLDKAAKMRAQASIAGRAGDFGKANTAEAEADTLEATHVFMEGRKIASNGDAFDAAAAHLSRDKEFPVTIGKDSHGRYQMSITPPNGKTTMQELTLEQRQTIMGAGALLAAGYQAEAMGKFASVSADLAAAVSMKNAALKDAAVTNNKTIHEESGDDSARITANAHATMAQAAVDRVNMEKTKQAFGKPVDTVNDKGEAEVMQPYMVNGKITFEKVALPAGSHFPKQAAEQKFEKTGDGAGIMRDAHSGTILYKVDNNVPMPAEADPWASKDGQKKQAEWQDKGVVRGVVADAKGKLHWGYTSTDDPESKPYTSPEEALKNKPAAAGKSKLPGAPSGRGLPMPNEETLAEAAKMRAAATSGIRNPAPEGQTDGSFSQQ